MTDQPDDDAAVAAAAAIQKIQRGKSTRQATAATRAAALEAAAAAVAAAAAAAEATAKAVEAPAELDALRREGAALRSSISFNARREQKQGAARTVQRGWRFAAARLKDARHVAAALALSPDQAAEQVMEICGCTLAAAEDAIEKAGGSVDVRRLAVELALGGIMKDDTDEEFKMTALVRSDLGMGPGKIAEQVSRATLGAYRDACTVNPDAVRAWMACGEPIIVLQVENLKELYGLLAAARARGLVAHSASATGTTTVGLIGPGLVAEVDAVCRRRHLTLL